MAGLLGNVEENTVASASDEAAASRVDETEGSESDDKDKDKDKAEGIKSEAIDVTCTGGAPQQAHRPWYRQPNPLRWRAADPVPSTPRPSPENQAGFFSQLSFQWIAGMMTTGYKRRLELNDIYTVNPARAVDGLTASLAASFDRRVARGDRRPLLGAMHETFFWEFWFGGLCSLVSTVLQCVSPYMLRYLIEFATEAYVSAKEGGPAPNIGRGLGLVFGVTLMQMVQSLGTNHFMYRGMVIGGMARASLISMMFEKSMRISGRARAGGTAEADDKTKDDEGWGNGRVVNLMSVDTARIDQASGMFHLVWTAPLSIVITLVLLVINLTYSALAGFGLLVIGLPILMRVIKSLITRRQAINKLTDQRVSLTQEILQSVRFVKFFGWELPFLDRLEQLRAKELSSIQVLLTLRNAMLAVSLSLPIFASMLAFITYTLSNHGLTAANVFSSLALFNALRMPLNMLPMVIGQTADAKTSLKRIQDFLLADEAREDVTMEPDSANAVELRQAGFTWEPNTTEAFQLHELELAIGRKELVAVIGTVGSGKTSLLAALAGDMRKTSGEVVLGAKCRAFCPQYAWMQNSTVQSNILFGKPLDRGWYDDVVEACALRPDIEMLPHHDQTEIGERGITISGGQKQRLNMARAIYSDAEMVLMDDPLSAVDAHVGRHIFDKAILGLLKDKCRVLATHQLWVLGRCDRIVRMDSGRIREVGTFEALMRDSAEFRQLIESTAMEKETTTTKGEENKKDEAIKEAKEAQGLMQTEERAVAGVPWSVYTDYVNASGSFLWAVPVFLLLVISQGANVATSLWLSWWTSDKFSLSLGTYIGVYAGLAFSQVVLTFGFMVVLSVLGSRASRVLLRKAMRRVLRAPMSFFDTTPLGRITNRFSRDIDVMDNQLSEALRMYLFSLAMMLSVFALMIAYFPYFAVALAPPLAFFLLATGYYRASAREVKRFESVLRSNLFAKFGEGLSGMATIRAYGMQDRFARDLRDAIDHMDAAYYLTFANQRWLATRLDLVGNALVLATGILVVTSRFSVEPSVGGLVLSYMLSIVQMIQYAVRQLAEVENAMNAVERILYYGQELEEEAPLRTVAVRPSWPEKGEIVFSNVEMRYRAGLPLVLQGLTMHVHGGERVGIVGRTGAGKSSIMTTLFRMVELSGGHITIDGIDISTMGLQDLRSRLAIIPQDPTLFLGTVRSNLDPFGEHTDADLVAVLGQAGLGSVALDAAVEVEGMNFSLGQRQLMALARALARGSRIIVCDEATSSVDMDTDAAIQATMATAFAGRTLLCIAHRLRTVVGYDRICVMDRGRIAELGAPEALWREEGGIFRAMCERSGISLAHVLAARGLSDT